MNWRFLRGHEQDDPGPSIPDSDARVVGTHPRRQAEDVEVARRLRLRRRATVIALSTVFVLGGMGALVGGGGVLEVRRLRSQSATLRAKVARHEAALRAVRTTVSRLEENSLETERLAREELGMVRPGEIDFLLPRKPRDPSTKGAE
jgi:cell division protein FtsB